jgi:hypothetical protein
MSGTDYDSSPDEGAQDYGLEDVAKGPWTPIVSCEGMAGPAATARARRLAGCVPPPPQPANGELSGDSQEDQLLREMVSRHGARNWSLIAQSLRGRSGKSCRLR